MKNLSLALNVVLLLAVGVLFYLHFAEKETQVSDNSSSQEPGDLMVAFINSDTVLKYYDYFKVNKDALEAKGRKMDSDFRNRAQALQKDIASYQNNAGNLTINQARAAEEDIARKQQNLRMYQETLANQLSTEEGKLNVELYNRVTNFLKEYSEANGIQVVMKYDPTSDLLFGSNALDITQPVIAGLNDAYRQEKTSTSQKQDSTNTKK